MMQPGIISQARSLPDRFQVRQNVLFVSRPWRTFFSGAGTNPTEAPPQGNDLPPGLPARIFGGKGESAVKTIAALTQIPGKPGRMRVEFRNGEPVELAMDIIARHRLLVGHAVSAETLRAAQEEDARKEAETAALKLLNRKNCSEQELRRTLRANGFGERLVDDVVDKCRGWGYLDDRHLAEMVVTDAIERRHLGPARIRETLRKRGLDPCAATVRRRVLPRGSGTRGAEGEGTHLRAARPGNRPPANDRIPAAAGVFVRYHPRGAGATGGRFRGRRVRFAPPRPVVEWRAGP